MSEDFTITDDYAVLIKPKRGPEGDVYWCDFTVYEVFYRGDDGVLVYRMWGENQMGVPTENRDEANIVCHGFVKWDGCSEWQFEEEGAHHFCGRKEAHELIDAVYDACKQVMAIDNEE